MASATLPRIKSPITPPSVSLVSAWQTRPHSEFDAGINSSTAWTQHLEKDQASLSDDELEEDEEQERGRPARAIYRFEGKPEFRELILEAGDEIEVLKEDLADGWSLVNHAGQIGLLPRTYYIFTSDFIPASSLDLSSQPHNRDPSTNSITPRGSPTRSALGLPLQPQPTGEWRSSFPSFRQSLLGGKSLNRFSSFVTSGAEEWVLKGVEVEDPSSTSHDEDHDGHEEEEEEGEEDEENRLSRLGQGEADRHFVDAPPAWKPKLPPFRVIVHSPSKRTSSLSGAYTMYNVTSLFLPPSNLADGDNAVPASPTRVTVHRRFSHFVVLHTALTRRLPGIALPPLPEKQYAGRFSDDFVEARRGDLERYLGRVVRHPVARYAEVLTFFLGCESDIEWKRLLPKHLALPPAGPTFFARVFHPAFNLDAEDAAESVDRFEQHTRAVSKGVQGLRSIFGAVRAARVQMSQAERLLSYSLLSLITSKPLASAPTTGIREEDEDIDQTNNRSRGLLNEEGAWCWREGCEDCLKLTKGIQKTAEALQGVADLYDDHARRRQLVTHESLKDVAHPSSLYAPVVDTHRSTLSRYKEATREHKSNDDVASRCETVLNTTMAEMETYHVQKVEDFRMITTDHLDGEIAFHEQVLARLRAARETFDQPQYDYLAMSPRQPSFYERELENPRLSSPHLPQPCPHVFDSAPMRPVSVAIQEGVGMLLGSGNPTGRASVFGKFW